MLAFIPKKRFLIFQVFLIRTKVDLKGVWLGFTDKKMSQCPILHLSTRMLITLSALKHKSPLGILSGVIFTSIFSLCSWVQACLDTHSSGLLSVSHRESTRACQDHTHCLSFFSALSRHNSKLLSLNSKQRLLPAYNNFLKRASSIDYYYLMDGLLGW